jgi:hypothetical protein
MKQAEHLTRKVERQELQIAAQAEREQMSKAMLAHLRQVVDLGTVMTVLGGERDRDDRHTWRLDGEVISITGEKFYNHTQQQGGRGAIELLHAQRDYTFRQALAYLRDHFGSDVAVVAAARHAQQIVTHEPSPPFRVPEPDSRR